MPITTRNESDESVLAPGATIEVRDAAWRVRKIDRTSSGGLAIEAVGLSELVEDKEAIFLTEYEPNIDVLHPADTSLVPDDSSLSIEKITVELPRSISNLAQEPFHFVSS